MIGRPKKVCDAYSRMNVPGAIKTKSARKSDSSKAAQNAAKKNVQKQLRAGTIREKLCASLVL